MAVLDDELLLDAEQDAEIVAYVRQQLPQELKEAFDDDTLYYFHDVLEEYIAESGVLDTEADDDDFVDIDLEQIAKHIQKKAAKEGVGQFEADDLLLVVDAELSFAEGLED